MAAGLTFKVGADTTALGKGLRRAGSMVGKFSAGMKKMGLAGLAVVAAGATAALAGMAVAARGVKSAIDFGGALSDLSSRTGILVGNLVILQRAFKDNGIAGDQLGPVINKMQKGITDFGAGLSTQVRAFDRLGMSYDDIAGKNPAEQFEMIQKGLTAIKDPTVRAATAMDIFGRSGGQLQALFDDSSAMDKARTSIGGQADILNKSAADFDRASDLMNGMGDKLRGFFVGMASYITPVLLPVLENLNKVDLAGWGQAVGRFVSVLGMAFSEGKLGGMIKDSLVIGAKAMVSSLWAGIKAISAFWGTYMVEGVKMAWSKITDKSFWSGVLMIFRAAAEYLNGAAHKLAAAWHGKQYEETGEALQRNAGLTAGRALRKMGEAGDGRNPLDVLIEAAEAAGVAYKKAIADPLMDGTAEIVRLKKTWEEMQRLAEEQKKAAEEEKQDDGTKPGIANALGRAVAGVIKPQVTALQRVGGASLGGVAMNMDLERNRLLRSIDRKVGRPAGGYV